MRFHGVDVLTQSRVEAGRLRQGVASVLSLEGHRVSVIRDVACYPERGAADVVCVVTPIQGDFSDSVSIQCDPIEAPVSSIIEFAQRLSVALGSAVLVPDEGHDPYVMWHVDLSGGCRKVSLDESALESDTYKVRDLAR